jgi:hypothetical protein
LNKITSSKHTDLLVTIGNIGELVIEDAIALATGIATKRLRSPSGNLVRDQVSLFSALPGLPELF